MRFSSFLRRAWFVVPLLAGSFVFWVAHERAKHVSDVTNFAEWSVDPLVADAASPTGLVHGWRRLINPEHNSVSYQGIIQTQQMLARGEGRMRTADYDNAPFGRPLHQSSLYRGWLAGVSGLDHLFSGRPLALAVEHGVLWADPGLHALLVLSASWFVARWIGRRSGVLVAVGGVGFFPLAGNFTAGSPSAEAMSLLCAAWSVLPVAVGVWKSCGAGETESVSPRRMRVWFGLAGVAGGAGLWVNVDYQWQVLAALAAGGLAAAWLRRRDDDATDVPLPWQWWGLCGCLTSVLAYAWEYFPGHMAWRFEANHPTLALAWWGVGGVLAWNARWAASGRRPWKSRVEVVTVGLSLTVAIGAVGAMIATGERGWLPDHPASGRLANDAAGIAAASFGDWVGRDGFGARAWATVLPLSLVLTAASILVWGKERRRLAAVAVAGAPLLVTVAMALQHLRAWSWVDLMTLVLVAVVAQGGSENAPSRGRSVLTALVVGVAGFGIAQVWPTVRRAGANTFSEGEVQAIVERDLAHWLAQRAGHTRAVVFAPPQLTSALYFHGGLRGIGTLDPENADGFSAALRIASATTDEEAETLLRQRDVAYIVMPSWDDFLAHYVQLGLRAELGSAQFEKSFVAGLDRWEVPRWLRPVPYRLPKAGGFAGKTAAVFEVVDEQDAPTATARLAAYFVETEQVERAAGLRAELQRYPGDLGALVALAEIANAAGDAAGFQQSTNALLPLVAARADRRLAWDRRVALAVVLTQAKRVDLASEQVRRCVAQMDEKKLRLLTTGSLVRFYALCQMAGAEIADERLRKLGLKLLPPDLRAAVR